MTFPNTIDSNSTGIAIAEEVLGSPKTLPGTPVWYEQEPNDYQSFGGQIKTVVRNPINKTRQNRKGTITDIDVNGGFSTDITANNMNRLYQGFFFCDGFDKSRTTSQLNDTDDNNPASVVNGTGEYTFASTVENGTVSSQAKNLFSAGDLVLAKGFSNTVNNGLFRVESVSTVTMNTDNTASVTETPPLTAYMQQVGVQIGSGFCEMSIVSNKLRLTFTNDDVARFNLNKGEWIYIGGDTTGTRFATAGAYGYARIFNIVDNGGNGYIDFDKFTGTAATDNGSGKTIRLFFGTFFRNPINENELKKRSYTLERQLGNDGDGIQSQLVKGAFANELALKLPLADKLTADLSFVGLDTSTRTGLQGLSSGTRIAGLGEDAINTSSSLVRAKLNLVQDTLTPTSQFAYMTELNINCSNGVKPNKAIGVVGAIGTSTGNFVVSGSITAYFSNVAAIEAVRSNADVTADVIIAQKNGGMVFDIPLMSLGNAELSISADEPITVPLESNAAMNSFGYTFGITAFAYLPTIAMPS